ncbi:helix-turn-helix domain-containing protein [Candidatus Tisiphia endosymbiont of Neophilaenus lineatus]|uniref:helix-turn-helix domain-containing protein n=1 Tax=Candidatus Tisiphia endosymbiont of Neophilaenus lineatus TaxID=3139336 RepID=UPI0035C9B363
MTGKELHIMLLEEYGAKCAFKTVYNTMHRLGFSWITSRSMHPKSNQETQNRYKKTFQTC